MLKAILFDFNGILLDDEPLHFRSMRSAAAGILGLSISWEDYWARYLPLDDESALDAISRDHDLNIPMATRRDLLVRKREAYQEMLREQYQLFPGAAALVRGTAQRYPLGIVSGAQKEEIERTLRACGLIECFSAIAGAQDFDYPKPHPESFLRGLELLNAVVSDGRAPIRAGECLVVEDSIAGVQGSLQAGMVCLAVTNTYPRDKLEGAHRVVDTLDGLSLESLEELFGEQL